MIKINSNGEWGLIDLHNNKTDNSWYYQKLDYLHNLPGTNWMLWEIESIINNYWKTEKFIRGRSNKVKNFIETEFIVKDRSDGNYKFYEIEFDECKMLESKTKITEITEQEALYEVKEGLNKLKRVFE